MHDDELSTLLAAERPRPRETFVAGPATRVAPGPPARGRRWSGGLPGGVSASSPPRPRPAGSAPTARARRWATLLQRPFLPAAATALAVGLVALVVALRARAAPAAGLPCRARRRAQGRRRLALRRSGHAVHRRRRGDERRRRRRRAG